MLDYLLVLLAIVIVAGLFGGMLFFAGVALPMIRSKLPGDTAAEFLEEAFPIYYLTAAVTAFLGTAAAARPNPISAGVLGIIGLSYLYMRVFLLPRINNAKADPDIAAQARFRRLHKQSVLLTIIQIAVVMAVLLFLAIVGPLAAVLTH